MGQQEHGDGKLGVEERRVIICNTHDHVVFSNAAGDEHVNGADVLGVRLRPETPKLLLKRPHRLSHHFEILAHKREVVIQRCTGTDTDPDSGVCA